MGKYAPVIKTAECGSMTRAAQTMGYTQPSLGYIINNIENEHLDRGRCRPAGNYAPD